MSSTTIDLDAARQSLRYAITTQTWAAVQTALDHLGDIAAETPDLTIPHDVAELDAPSAVVVADGTMEAPAATLRAVLVRAGKAIDRHAQVEALRAVRIYSAAGTVYVEAQTAGSHAARFAVVGATAGEFDALLDHKALSAALKGAGKRDTVTLTCDAGAVASVSYGATSATFAQARQADWRTLDFDPADAKGFMAAPGETFAPAIAAAASHASVDWTRPILCALRIEANGTDSVRLVATDSYRLIVRETACEVFGEPEALQLPAAILALATAKATGDVCLFATTNGAMLMRDGETWTMRGHDGQYPNWQHLMPDGLNCELSFDRAELLAALQGAARVAVRNAPVRFTFTQGQTVVSVANAGQPAFSATVSHVGSLDAWSGGDIGANAEFCASALLALDGDTVTLGASSPLRPMLWGVRQGATRALVMPIRLND